jgi:hypothetical protein
VPKRLNEMDSDEIRALLGPDYAANLADDQHAGGPVEELN